jgi:phage terminase large subunit-like protein
MLSKEQIAELHRCATDPLHFIEQYIKIEHPSLGAVPFELYEYQRDYIREIHTGNVIAAFGRQMGKTSLTCAYALWHSIFNPNQNILFVSQKVVIAQEIMSKIHFMRSHLAWISDLVRANKNELQFDNGSRIMSVVGNRNTARGMSLNMIVLDELAYWPEKQVTECLETIVPCLVSTNAKIVIPSTPGPNGNQFIELFKLGEAGPLKLKPIRYSYELHPHRGAEWMQNQRAMLGSIRFEQEYGAIVNG